MRNVFRNFITNRELFFDLFDQAAQTIVEMTTLLQYAVKTPDSGERENFTNRINKLSVISDDIAHKINLWLSKIMFTPINRNDIHTLISALNEIADMTQEAASRMYLYEIDNTMPAIKDITAILLESGLKIQQCISQLRDAKGSHLIIELCKLIKDDERQSDKVYYHAVAGLFSDEKDPVRLLKYREILLSLENAVNKCKNVSDILSTMVISRT